MKKTFIISLLSLLSAILSAQSVDVPLSDYSSYLLERQAILSGNEDDIFLNLKPYDRLEMAKLSYRIADENGNPETDYILDENEMFLYQIAENNQIDTAGFQKIGDGEKLLRASKNPFLKYFYRTPAQFFQLDKTIDGRHYRLRVNPILQFKAGPTSGEGFLFTNQRGIQLDMSLDERLYVSSTIVETQRRFPPYVTDFIQQYKAIPRNGFYKGYNSTVFNTPNAYDFLNSTAKLGFKIIPSIGLEFGYGNNHIGHGIRSLALSDFADNYMFLGLNTKVGRLAYRNVFGELKALSTAQEREKGLIPKKYFASHYLGYKVLPNLQLGLFETVVFSRENNFEFHYMNPIILYRTVEGAIGSPDNVMLGLDGRWDFLNHYSLYGQLALDELKVEELIFDNRGWWGNKYSFQLGLKAFDILNIKGLDGQLEMNSIRPFMYSHRDSSATWTHGNQSLAHPLGANLREYLLKLRYRPSIKWDIEVTAMFLNQGVSPEGENYGEDPRISYNSRSRDYGNALLQGIESKTRFLRTRFSYMLWHNAFIELEGQYRNNSLSDDNIYLSLGFRWNAPANRNVF